MDKIFLGTNIIIHLVRGKEKAKEIKSLIDSLSDPQLFISVVSLLKLKAWSYNGTCLTQRWKNSNN